MFVTDRCVYISECKIAKAHARQHYCMSPFSTSLSLNISAMGFRVWLGGITPHFYITQSFWLRRVTIFFIYNRTKIHVSTEHIFSPAINLILPIKTDCLTDWCAIYIRNFIEVITSRFPSVKNIIFLKK